MAGTSGSGVFLVDSKFSSGTLYFYEKTVGRTTTGDLFSIGTSQITVGNTAQDVDFVVYLGSATEYVLFDVGNSRVDFGVSGTGVDVRFFGDTAGSDFLWDQNGATNGMLSLGADTKSVDFKVFGATTGNYMLYDGSEDKLSVVQSNAATSGVETSFSNAMTLTGIGASAEAAVNSITINAAAGTYTNAFCARATYGASGKTTGLSGVICSEINLSAGCTDGTYTLFEGEMIMASGALTGTATSFFCLNVSGAAASTFDTNGFLFDIQGVTSNSGKFWYANKSVPFDAYLKIRVGSTTYYLGVLAQQAAAT